jgi:hypothetical protein
MRLAVRQYAVCCLSGKSGAIYALACVRREKYSGSPTIDGAISG